MLPVLQLPVMLFTGATLVVVLFQVALVLRAPWGEFTQGDKHQGKLPVGARFIAAASIPLLLASQAILLARAGGDFGNFVPRSSVLAWVVVALLVLSCVANAVTPSKKERILWLPISLCMLGCSVMIALS